MNRILIVDDEQIVCKLLVNFLASDAIICSTALSVAEAKQRLTEQDFDLVLTDINMPDASGFDLLEYVQEWYPDLGVVIVSVIDDPEEARKCVQLGVYGYIIKPFTKNHVLITVDNALRHLHLERKERQLKQSSEEKIRLIMDQIGIGIAMIGTDGRVLEMNRQMQSWFPHVEIGGNSRCYQLFIGPERSKPCFGCPTMQALATGNIVEGIVGNYQHKGQKSFRIKASPVKDQDGRITAAIEMLEDVTEQLIMEQELRQAQKLETIGQLAAGIAHEINTPIQYVSDNVNFLEEAFGDLNDAITLYEQFLNTALKEKVTQVDMAFHADFRAKLADIDLDYLVEEVPRSIEQSLDGLQRVADIVRAMKQVSHPGSDSKQTIDINHLLENVIVISRNEWKYVAEIETCLDPDLPTIECYPDKLNQVFLNLIVNAAHAIGEAIERNRYAMGKITVTTSLHGAAIRIIISDNGPGIPKAVGEKVYELFFTTKPAGKGTGQGLAIAKRIIIEEHQGTLSFTSNEQNGTDFLVELPLASPTVTL